MPIFRNSFRNSTVGNDLGDSPHLVVFLGSGGDFVGYLLGEKFYVVHEGLLCFVAADVHHLDYVVFVAEIHVGDSGASGGVARHAFEARQEYVAVQVGLRLFAIFFQRVLLLHRQICRHFLFQCRYTFGQIFKYVLDITVQHLLVGFRYVVVVFLTDCNEVLVHHGNSHFCLGFLLNKPDNACTLSSGLKMVFVEIVIVTDTLTGIATNEKNIAHMLFLPGQRHFIECL